MNEGRLIQRVREGDDDAFRILRTQYNALIHNYLKKYACNHAAFPEDDLLQEASIGLYRAACDFNGKGKFAGYAKVCIRRQVLDYVRSYGGMFRLSRDYYADKRVAAPYLKGDTLEHIYNAAKAAGLSESRALNLMNGSRKEKVYSSSVPIPGTTETDDDVQPDPYGEDGCRLVEALMDIERYLEGLPMSRAALNVRLTAFRLVALEGRSSAEAGEVVGYSKSSVWVLVYEARKILKECYERD